MLELIVIILVLGAIFGGSGHPFIAGNGSILWTIVMIFVVLEILSLLFGGSYHHMYI